MGRSDSLNVFGTGFLVVRRPLPPRASVFVSPHGPNAGRGAWGHWVRRLPVRSLSRRNVRASQVPGEPWCAYAVFLDPGGNASPMAVGRSVVAPASGNNKGSPRVRQSRGSIARPEH